MFDSEIDLLCEAGIDPRDALGAAQLKVTRGIFFWFSLFGCLFLIFGLGFAFIFAFHALTGCSLGILLLTGLLVMSIAAVSGMNALWKGKLTRALRHELVLRGIPICVQCGYDLRGQEAPRCPECATPFEHSQDGLRTVWLVWPPPCAARTSQIEGKYNNA